MSYRLKVISLPLLILLNLQEANIWWFLERGKLAVSDWQG